MTSITQVGTDRILEFQFSEGQYKLFLEFYAGGNIVLTDKELKVIALLRNVSEGADYEHLQFGSLYNLSERQNINGIPRLSVERVKEGLQKYVDKQASGQQGQKGKHKVKAGDELRKALAGSINEFPPLLLDHALRTTGFDTSLLPAKVLGDDGLIDGVLKALEEAGRVITEIMGKDTARGYIIAKSNIAATKPETLGADNTSHMRESLLYYDFHPFRPKQFEDDLTVSILEFEGFNRTVDEFFSSIEGQKLESRLQEREDHAKKKLEHARQDQANRLGALQTIQELNVRKAQAIEANLERVEEATAAINGLIAQGKDWIEIEKLIEIEQKRQNPVAEIIKIPLKLHENTATLLLGEWNIDTDEDENGDVTDSEPSASDAEEDDVDSRRVIKSRDKELKPIDKRLVIDIDLALSGWANAREYYDHKKIAAAKEEKTLLASAKALKSQTHKIESDLKRALNQEKAILRPVRTPLWFEKFIYFISSDGYLVIGGKDAQQSDTLYKRYLKKGDLYVHADLNGAASVLIKNNPSTPDAPVPPSTLSQAGNMSVATSSAWDSKAVMSAWWVSANQVSKVAYTGDYLDAGKFEIRGQKNFLPPAQLLLGFAVIFLITDDSKARHSKHRFLDGAAAQKNLSVQGGHDFAEEALPDDSADILTDGEDESEDSFEAPGDEEEPQADYQNPLQTGSISQSDDEHREQDLNDKDDEITANEIEHEPRAQSTTQTVAVQDKDSLQKQPPEKYHSPEQIVQDSSDEESQVEQCTQSQTKQKGPIPVRGKRGKKKKIAAKYADQDEEDRAEAMRLLGSKAGQEKAEENSRAQKAREQEAELQKQRRREQHQRAQKDGKQQEELRRIAQEELGDVDDDDEQVTAIDLDTLIGTPLPGDEILEAMPVCAPWNALGKYKYKAKIQPGNQKKGKAIREILGRWAIDGANPKFVDKKSEDVERIWPRETELIKGWKDTEIFNVMPVGKVRVMMSGAAGGKGGGGTQVKGKARGGKGSKKPR